MALTCVKLIVKIILDFSSVSVIFCMTGFIWLWANPVERGFFCGDTSIRYPFRSETITAYSLFILAFVPPLLIIILNETLRFKMKKVPAIGYRLLLKEFYFKIFPLIYGFAWTLLVTIVAKKATGRLRPYFHSVCQPNINCDASNLLYIEKFQCTGLDKASYIAVKELRGSFMSGHSSTIAFTMVYLSIYLQMRLNVTSSTGILIRSLMQGLSLNLALFVGYTRISDYWHHWSDVAVGLLQGTIAAIVIAKYVSDLLIGNKSINKQLSLINSEMTSNESGEEYQVRLIKQTSI